MIVVSESLRETSILSISFSVLMQFISHFNLASFTHRKFVFGNENCDLLQKVMKYELAGYIHRSVCNFWLY